MPHHESDSKPDAKPESGAQARRGEELRRDDETQADSRLAGDRTGTSCPCTTWAAPRTECVSWFPSTWTVAIWPTGSVAAGLPTPIPPAWSPCCATRFITHTQDMFHRDIKPANIQHGNRLV